MPKILLFDIETAPLRGALWSLWKQTIGMSQVFSDWYMLTWSAKWLGERRIMGEGLHMYRDPYDDRPIIESLHKLIDEADIVVAHNGDRFDIKKMNTRFIQHGLSPPSPYRTVDTLKVAKRHFAFTSNRLDALGMTLGLGRKLETGGMDLWMRCLEGDKCALRDMLKYNKQDVQLLEDVYLALLPWDKLHPNMGAMLEGEETVCSKCGSEDLQRRGYSYTQIGKYQRYQCNVCGGWSTGRYNCQTKDKMKELVKNA